MNALKTSVLILVLMDNALWEQKLDHLVTQYFILYSSIQIATFLQILTTFLDSAKIYNMSKNYNNLFSTNRGLFRVTFTATLSSINWF